MLFTALLFLAASTFYQSGEYELAVLTFAGLLLQHLWSWSSAGRSRSTILGHITKAPLQLLATESAEQIRSQINKLTADALSQLGSKLVDPLLVTIHAQATAIQDTVARQIGSLDKKHSDKLQSISNQVQDHLQVFQRANAIFSDEVRASTAAWTKQCTEQIAEWQRRLELQVERSRPKLSLITPFNDLERYRSELVQRLTREISAQRAVIATAREQVDKVSSDIFTRVRDMQLAARDAVDQAKNEALRVFEQATLKTIKREARRKAAFQRRTTAAESSRAKRDMQRLKDELAQMKASIAHPAECPTNEMQLMKDELAQMKASIAHQTMQPSWEMQQMKDELAQLRHNIAHQAEQPQRVMQLMKDELAQLRQSLAHLAERPCSELEQLKTELANLKATRCRCPGNVAGALQELQSELDVIKPQLCHCSKAPSEGAEAQRLPASEAGSDGSGTPPSSPSTSGTGPRQPSPPAVAKSPSLPDGEDGAAAGPEASVAVTGEDKSAPTHSRSEGAPADSIDPPPTIAGSSTGPQRVVARRPTPERTPLPPPADDEEADLSAQDMDDIVLLMQSLSIKGKQRVSGPLFEQFAAAERQENQQKQSQDDQPVDDEMTESPEAQVESALVTIGAAKTQDNKVPEQPLLVPAAQKSQQLPIDQSVTSLQGQSTQVLLNGPDFQAGEPPADVNMTEAEPSHLGSASWEDELCLICSNKEPHSLAQCQQWFEDFGADQEQLLSMTLEPYPGEFQSMTPGDGTERVDDEMMDVATGDDSTRQEYALTTENFDQEPINFSSTEDMGMVDATTPAPNQEAVRHFNLPETAPSFDFVDPSWLSQQPASMEWIEHPLLQHGSMDVTGADPQGVSTNPDSSNTLSDNQTMYNEPTWSLYPVVPLLEHPPTNFSPYFSAPTFQGARQDPPQQAAQDPEATTTPDSASQPPSRPVRAPSSQGPHRASRPSRAQHLVPTPAPQGGGSVLQGLLGDADRHTSSEWFTQPTPRPQEQPIQSNQPGEHSVRRQMTSPPPYEWSFQGPLVPRQRPQGLNVSSSQQSTTWPAQATDPLAGAVQIVPLSYGASAPAPVPTSSGRTVRTGRALPPPSGRTVNIPGPSSFTVVQARSDSHSGPTIPIDPLLEQMTFATTAPAVTPASQPNVAAQAEGPRVIVIDGAPQPLDSESDDDQMASDKPDDPGSAPDPGGEEDDDNDNDDDNDDDDDDDHPRTGGLTIKKSEADTTITSTEQAESQPSTRKRRRNPDDDDPETEHSPRQSRRKIARMRPSRPMMAAEMAHPSDSNTNPLQGSSQIQQDMEQYEPAQRVRRSPSNSPEPRPTEPQRSEQEAAAEHQHLESAQDQKGEEDTEEEAGIRQMMLDYLHKH